MATSSNVRMDDKLWTDMIDKTIRENAKYMTDIDFWVELKEMTDREGNVYYQEFPRLSVNFK
jgi:hypothetical protein